MALQVFCLDASQCASLNEDIAGDSLLGPSSRFLFQKKLVGCLSQACLARRGGELASALEPPQEVALVVSHGGKAAVAMPPGSKGSLLPTLDALPTGGVCNPAAALKLAVLLARRFQSARVTAFIASPCQLSQSEAQELRHRIEGASAALSVDVVVLTGPGEQPECTLAAISLLSSSPHDGKHESGAACNGAIAAVGEEEQGRGCQVVWANAQSILPCPREGAATPETWQHVEAVLEQLERHDPSARPTADDSAEGATIGAPSAATHAGPLPPNIHASSSSSRHRGAPSRIRRAPVDLSSPLRRPRVPLLATRSGVFQPALCRHESLDWLGHLSMDGMMRPWLPTYASLAERAQQAQRGGKQQHSSGAGRGGAAGGVVQALAGSEQCFLQVCPVPRWRTLLKISAGIMRSSNDGAAATTAAADGDSATQGIRVDRNSSASSAFASLSSALLMGLEALQLADDGDDHRREHSSDLPGAQSACIGSRQQHVEAYSDCSGSPAQEGAAQSDGVGEERQAVRLVPDKRCGTLRVLQALKEPRHLKLVWAPREETSSPAEQDMAEGSTAGCAAQQQPFNMFGGTRNTDARQHGLHGTAASAALAGLLGDGTTEDMDATSVDVPAQQGACQPIYHSGVEYWESGARFEAEVPLLWPDAGDAGQAAATRLSGHELANGAQLLLVAAGAEGKVWAHAGAKEHPHQLGFWLQQRWRSSCLLPSSGAAAIDAVGLKEQGQAGDLQARTGMEEGPAGGAATSNSGCDWEECREGLAEMGAVAAAAAVCRMEADPPSVDLRELRRAIKNGALKVTPLMVGPLPSKFVADIVSTRASIMKAMGMENMDTMGTGTTSRDAADGMFDRDKNESTAAEGGCAAFSVDGGSSGQHCAGGGSSKRQRRGDGGKERGLQVHQRGGLSLLQGRLLCGRRAKGGDPVRPNRAKPPCSAAQEGDDSTDRAPVCCQAHQQPSAVAGGEGAGLRAAAHSVPAAMDGLSAGSTPYGTPMQIVPSTLLALEGGRGEGRGIADVEGGEGMGASHSDAAPGHHVGGGEIEPVVPAEQSHQERGDDSVLFDME